MPPGLAEARAIGVLLAAGGILGLLSVALPHPDSADDTALVLTALPMVLAGALCWAFAQRVPMSLNHLLLGAASFVAGLYIYEAAVAAGVYGSVFVWGTMIAAYFFPKRVAVAHLAWTLAVFAVTLAVVPSTAGFSPLTRWLFTAISLTLILLLVSYVVANRAQADRRARRFFDLSQDMLCTLDHRGRIVEINEAWEQHLGYTAEEMQGRYLIEITHPDDRERAIEEAIRVFKGEPSARLENKVFAKDGAVHWLRSSSALAPEENMLYARATDITELKRVEAEREELLAQVEDMARRDPLTGLPNRRTLIEEMPREMGRARRNGAELCVAIVDVDHFKAFNDSRGHLAGDEMLRDCAAAWDEALRGEDLLIRYGGEEFLVVLPNASLDQAGEAIERLRGATPGEATCSAGVALWDGAEDMDALIARADAALYRAKSDGRDRLALATL